MAYMNPYYQQQIQPMTNMQWVYVNGMDGARSQIVQPNQTIWMMDNNDPVIYVKNVDSLGTVSLKAFKLTEISLTAKQTEDLSNYVSRHEFEALKTKFEHIEKELGGVDA